jgi:hypothetical protein
MLKSCKVLGVAVLFLAGTTLSQRVARADLLPMQLLGVPSGENMGGVYTSPYQVSVNGTKMLLVCDDFTTDISIGHTWNAIVYQITQVTANGPQKFQHPSNPVTIPGRSPTDYTIQQQYDAVAWLAEQLLDGSLKAASYAAAIDSYAIWQIFDPTAVDGYGGAVLTGQEQTDVATAMSAAFAARQLDYQMYIYTPSPLSASQEFLGIAPLPLAKPFNIPVPVPEGSTLAFLALDSLAVLGIMLFVRRRLGQVG